MNTAADLVIDIDEIAMEGANPEDATRLRAVIEQALPAPRGDWPDCLRATKPWAICGWIWARPATCWRPAPRLCWPRGWKPRSAPDGRPPDERRDQLHPGRIRRL